MQYSSEQFSKVIKLYSEKMFAVAYTRTQNAADAEDVVQNVCIKLWEKRDDLPPDDQILRFILTVTRNASIDLLRARQDTCDFEEVVRTEAAGDDEIDDGNRYEDRDELRRLTQLLKKLPPDQQTVIRLSVMQGLDNEQISKLTGLKYDNIRQLLSRGRRKLRDLAINEGITV